MSDARIRLSRLAPFFLPAVALLIGGCTPQAITSQGQQIQNLDDITFGVAVVIFLIVEALILWAVIRYRRKPGQTELPVQTHGNNLLEVVWTVIPIAIVLVLFVLSWSTLNSVDATNASTNVQIRAVAQRFQWSFEYLSPDRKQVLLRQIAPELVVPAGTTVHLGLVSRDVTHSFYVPQFLFKRDVIPGQENNFDFNVDSQYAGQTFRGQCAQLCGTFHDAMRFTVKVDSPADYEAWLQQQIAAANASPTPAPSTPPASGGTSEASPAASGGTAASGQTVELTAKNIAFEQTQLTAPANVPFTLKFTNSDAGIPHNVEIHAGSSMSDPVVFDGEIFNGVGTRDYQVPALKPGTYVFQCKVHPNMTGTITVK